MIVTFLLLALTAGGISIALFLPVWSEDSAPRSLFTLLPFIQRTENASAPGRTVETSFITLWISDFKGNRILGLNRAGDVVWRQQMASAPLQPRSYNTNLEYISVAPNGNLITADGEGMIVQEIDRTTHEVVWQYGVKDVQGYIKGFLHQPDKSFKINDHEVLINDGNNRRVIIVDQRTNEIVWHYGETLRMGSTPGLLRGNTNAVPLSDGREILITDTLEKKIIIVNRATQQIMWEWRKPDARWLQHVFATPEGTFVLEDRQNNEVFEVNHSGQILWTLTHFSDGSNVRYPTDSAKLGNGNVLIAEAGRGRVIEVAPHTGEIVQQYNGLGFVTTIAIDQASVVQ